MAKYVDADKMLKEYEHGIYDTTDLAEMLYYMPAADVQEVRRGRWETEIITDALGCKHAYYACSLCGKASDDEYTYCPNCGAKMDEVLT